MNESRLNVFILGDKLSAREKERLQAQLQTAIRTLPQWTLDLLQRRIDELGIRNLAVIIEPKAEGKANGQSLSLGEIEGRPAVRLTPRITESGLEWGQDRRYLLAKAVAYLATPPAGDYDFWSRWREAVDSDGLRDLATSAGDGWAKETELGLLIEIFAAYAINPRHGRWSGLPAIRTFLETWRAV